MKKINKKQLIDAVSDNTHISKKETKLVIDNFVELIGDYLLNDVEVSILNLGTFKPKTKRLTNKINPKTGERISDKETKIISLKLSDSFKEKLNDK